MKRRTSTVASNGGREVIPAPNRLVRRSLEMMHGSVIGGRYRVLGSIGAGGMGSVYEGLDLRTGCKVALKALQPGTQSAIQLMRLRREAAAATSIKSDHVCQVHYLGVERGTPFIVMERLHGETLRARLNDEGPLPMTDAVTIICQVLDALNATHEAGIIHRDVKPSNVFLTSAREEPPRLKLIDFGVAAMIREPSESPLASDQITGTLGYLAPEQLLSLGDLDERADVYSAGVMFFEMLSGQRAYSGQDTEVIHDIVLGEPPKVAHLRPDVHPLFDDVLAMAMAKSRDRRFASARAFKRAVVAAWNASASLTSSGVIPKFADFDDEESDGSALTLRPPPVPFDETVADRPFDDDSPLNDFPTLRPPPFIPRGAIDGDDDDS